MANDLGNLVEILRQRDITYNRESIASALNDPESQTAVQAWMREYLSPATLLSKEEATLYAALVKSGEADALAVSHDLSAVRSVSDQEIQNAVAELRRSTASIEKQTEALRLQQNSLEALMKSNQRYGQARAKVDKSQALKWETDKVQITTTVEESAQGLQDLVSDLDQQRQAYESSFKQTMESIFQSDDKLLSSLQKLATDLGPQHEDDGSMAKIRELCARLIKHTVEGIRTRLDRIYLDGLNADQSNEHNEQEVRDLQEELESLYLEILPVAQMSAEQQFLQPALQQISSANGHSQQRSVKAVDYMNECLDFLLKRLEILLQRAEERQCHNMALDYILNEANNELQRPVLREQAVQERRKSSASRSPVRTRNVRLSISQLGEDVAPEQQLLSNIGISIPEDLADQVKAVERALADRLNRLEGHEITLQTTVESSISSHIQGSHATYSSLRDSLLAESPYDKVHLLDPDVDTLVSMFENDVKSLQESLDKVDLQNLQAKNPNQEVLVSRWSR